jgi:hypothetical protein
MGSRERFVWRMMYAGFATESLSCVGGVGTVWGQTFTHSHVGFGTERVGRVYGIGATYEVVY